MGQINIRDYFTKLDENESLVRHNGFIVEDGALVRKCEDEKRKFCGADRYLVGEKRCYAKKMKSDVNVFNEILLPRIYNECGINCAYVYPSYLMHNLPYLDEIIDNPDCRFLLSEDVKSLGFFVQEAQEVIDNFKTENREMHLLKKKRFVNHMLYLFNNKDVRERFLEIMTPKCIEQLENLFNASLLQTAWDTNQGNYFFYKEYPENERFDGIISIDNEHLLIDKWCNITTKINKPVKEWIIECVQWPEFMEGVLGEGLTTVKGNILRLKELIQSGELSDSQIEVLKKLINYDIEGEAQRLQRQYPTIKVPTKKIDFMKYLAEYNGNELESEI